MAIRIEARIEPNVTRIEPNLTRMRRLYQNNDPNVDPNRDEYGRMRRIRHRITRTRHRIVVFGPNLDPNYSRIFFPEVYIRLCRSCIFWPIRLIRLYSALYADGDSDGFWELIGLSGQIRLYSCHLSLFG